MLSLNFRETSFFHTKTKKRIFLRYKNHFSFAVKNIKNFYDTSNRNQAMIYQFERRF